LQSYDRDLNVRATKYPGLRYRDLITKRSAARASKANPAIAATTATIAGKFTALMVVDLLSFRPQTPLP
jgi:hypothetical protein